jgi:hypothetical protein
MPSDLEWLSAKYERSEAAFMRSVATGCERDQLADLAEATAASAAELLTEAHRADIAGETAWKPLNELSEAFERLVTCGAIWPTRMPHAPSRARTPSFGRSDRGQVSLSAWTRHARGSHALPARSERSRPRDRGSHVSPGGGRLGSPLVWARRIAVAPRVGLETKHVIIVGPVEPDHFRRDATNRERVLAEFRTVDPTTGSADERVARRRWLPRIHADQTNSPEDLESPEGR